MPWVYSMLKRRYCYYYDKHLEYYGSSLNRVQLGTKHATPRKKCLVLQEVKVQNSTFVVIAAQIPRFSLFWNGSQAKSHLSNPWPLARIRTCELRSLEQNLPSTFETTPKTDFMLPQPGLGLGPRSGGPNDPCRNLPCTTHWQFHSDLLGAAMQMN